MTTHLDSKIEYCSMFTSERIDKFDMLTVWHLSWQNISASGELDFTDSPLQQPWRLLRGHPEAASCSMMGWLRCWLTNTGLIHCCAQVTHLIFHGLPIEDDVLQASCMSMPETFIATSRSKDDKAKRRGGKLSCSYRQTITDHYCSIKSGLTLDSPKWSTLSTGEGPRINQHIGLA